MNVGDFATSLGTFIATVALVAATFMLVVVTWQLSKAADRQTEILEANQRMAVDRDKPKIRLHPTGRSIVRVAADGTRTVGHFDGFDIVNQGMVAVTVTGVGAVFAVPANTPEGRMSGSIPGIQFAPRKWHGEEIVKGTQ